LWLSRAMPAAMQRGLSHSLAASGVHANLLARLTLGNRHAGGRTTGMPPCTSPKAACARRLRDFCSAAKRVVRGAEAFL